MYHKENPREAMCPYCYSGTIAFDTDSGHLFCKSCKFIITCDIYPLGKSDSYTINNISIPFTDNIHSEQEYTKKELYGILKHYNI
jgi:transcription initiation factor TFIIIB Brf1 subunit/transcription initiation factor TFIIB